MPRKLLALLLGITLASISLFGQTKPADKSGTGNIYKRSIKSVVWVFDKVGANSARIGSGTLIDAKDRIIITNYHVVGDDTNVFTLFPILDKAGNPINDRNVYIRMINNGTAPKGKVIAREPKRDLAMIQVDTIPKETHAIRIAKDAVGTADTIHCIGNSGASAGLFDYCKGDVRNVAQRRSRLKDTDPPFEINAKMIEHSAPINKGQSGGPVLNDAGELVGVTQGHVPEELARNISLAVDLSEVKEFLKANKYARLLNMPPSTVASATESTKTSTPEADAKAEAARKESAAAFKLDSAKELIAAGKKEKAKERLEDIVKNYAETKSADEAKKLLDTLKN
jgi:S1-C subfamily serine protease